jgi:hypothetical protein
VPNDRRQLTPAAWTVSVTRNALVRPGQLSRVVRRAEVRLAEDKVPDLSARKPRRVRIGMTLAQVEVKCHSIDNDFPDFPAQKKGGDASAEPGVGLVEALIGKARTRSTSTR